jgi:chemotaxis signal transduction protein
VVQAIPVPDTLALLPLRGKALRGVIEHGGALVPVVDLARWVDVGSAAPEPGEAARILVLREEGRTIGLQVDALGGLVEAAAQHAVRLHHGDNPEDVFHSALQAPDSGLILNLLEVGRLADLALAWSQAAPAAAADTPRPGESADAADDADDADNADAAGASLYALLDTGQGVLGVQPAELAEVLPMPALQQLGAVDATYCSWRGRHLAVLPCAALMGKEDEAGQGSAPLLAVFAHAGLALGVPVRAVLQLRSLGPGLPVPEGVTATVFDADGAEIRLLDTARLFARYPEAALSRPGTPPAPAAGGAGSTGNAGHGRAANACAYIVFEADGVQAVPIGSVEHIAPLAQGATATMSWHGEAIRLVDLRAHDAAHGHVLVAHGSQGHVGYVVTHVQSLIPAGAGQMYRMGSGGRGTGRPVDFITVGEGPGQASYRIVELAPMAN